LQALNYYTDRPGVDD